MLRGTAENFDSDLDSDLGLGCSGLVLAHVLDWFWHWPGVLLARGSVR
jgi:hypothetical protein